MQRKYIFQILCLVMAVFLVLGCATTKWKKEGPKDFAAPEEEALWIREGKPIMFQGKEWYPLDLTENLLDEEVYYVGEYKGVQFFVEKVDVQPYNRIYTKFDKHEFRIFEPRDGRE